ncbi:MAG: VOC family protein, partial [Sulfuritalea sp.]|nr:VOC family protein [Sulfuritalea sp.]
MATPDHLVLATRDLDRGAGWLENLLGVSLAPGGRHERMGTHNRLLSLGDDLYLELIAIDPQAPSPSRPRWFALDRLTPELEWPRLIHWVARSENIQAEVELGGEALGEILPMERGDFRWRITVPTDGHLPADGLVPTLIQWDVSFHPTQRLPDAEGGLVKLEALHEQPERIRSALATLRLSAHL